MATEPSPVTLTIDLDKLAPIGDVGTGVEGVRVGNRVVIVINLTATSGQAPYWLDVDWANLELPIGFHYRPKPR